MPAEKLAFDFSVSGTLCLNLSGEWVIPAGMPSLKEVSRQFSIRTDIKRIIFTIATDFKWDSAFIAFLISLASECQHRKIDLSIDGLPQLAQKLFAITAKLRQPLIVRPALQEKFLERVGERTLQVRAGAVSVLSFLGEIAFAFMKMFSGKAYFRWEDFILITRRCGVDALGLVSLISILVGMILAFIGAIQLRIFGAQIYIADIVGIAMVRVMGAVMTAVLISGRTGASFAAELGIMQTNEEIDALKTFGINPVEFLVLPRVLALVIMMPLLTIYADLMGILGGFIISIGMLGLNPVEYWNHTQAAIKLNTIWIGLIHGFVFGIIVAICGCLRGMNCERSAEGVGIATTSAVVSAITNIVIATAIITYVCQVIGV